MSGEDEDTDTELINEFLNSGVQPEVPQPPQPTQVRPNKTPERPTSSGSQQFSKGQGKYPSSNEGTSDEFSQETFKEPKNCECVKYYLCNIDNGTVVDNGDVLGLIDIRLGASKPSSCPHYFDICCPVSISAYSDICLGVHKEEIISMQIILSKGNETRAR